MIIKHQGGSVLITVLIILIIVAVVGAVAMRQSVTGLNVATNSQIQTLLEQSTDSIFFAIEKDNKIKATLQRNINALGMFGMVKSDSYVDKELVFCYRPKQRANVFTISSASTIYRKSETAVENTELGVAGFCTRTSNDFTSGRDAVISQIAVKKGSLNVDTPFKFFASGTDNTTVQMEDAQPVKIIVTSVIPAATALSSTDANLTTAVNHCFKNYPNDVTATYPNDVAEVGGSQVPMTVAGCFAVLGIPYSQQVVDYAVINYAKKS